MSSSMRVSTEPSRPKASRSPARNSRDTTACVSIGAGSGRASPSRAERPSPCERFCLAPLRGSLFVGFFPERFIELFPLVELPFPAPRLASCGTLAPSLRPPRRRRRRFFGVRVTLTIASWPPIPRNPLFGSWSTSIVASSGDERPSSSRAAATATSTLFPWTSTHSIDYFLLRRLRFLLAC